MPEKKKVLITGAAGLIGTLIRKELGERYELSGVDIQEISGFDNLVADTTSVDAIQPAFEGVDVVIDLASNPDQRSPWNIVHGNNLACTISAFEAARKAGVKRIIFASSNHATGMYENDAPYSDIVAGNYDGLSPSDIPMIDTQMPVRPDGPYGIAKAFGEATGRYYHDEFGLSVICLRIGTLNREGRPTNPRQFATLLSHPDLIQLLQKCIDAPDDLGYAVFYGVSGNKWNFWDIANSAEAVGYKPNSNAEDYR